MKKFDKRIENIEKRIPEKHEELEEIRQQLKKEHPGCELYVESQGGTINCVIFPRVLSPDEWNRRIGKTSKENEKDD